MTSDNPFDTPRTPTSRATIAISTAGPPRLTTLILLSALAVLPVNTISPSLPHIAATFRVDFALVNLAVASYAIATALANLVAGALSDRCGRKPVALIAISIFIVASLGCALATDIGLFLLFRAMQASISTCFSIALVIIKETSAERKAASKLGYLAMGWAVAPMLGPLFGGFLDELFGWRAIFVVFATLGAAALALSISELKETAVISSGPRANYLASYGPLLRSARFWSYTLCMTFSTGTLYIFLGGAPLAIGKSLDGSTAALGLYMGMIPAGFILGSYLAGRYAARLSLGATLIVARLLTCVGLLAGLILSIAESTHILAFFGPCVFIGIGNGLTMPAANTGVLSVRADLAGTAAGLAAAMSIAGGAVIVSIAGVLVAQSTTIHTLFGAMLVSASFAMLAALYAAFLNRPIAEPIS